MSIELQHRPKETFQARRKEKREKQVTEEIRRGHMNVGKPVTIEIVYVYALVPARVRVRI